VSRLEVRVHPFGMCISLARPLGRPAQGRNLRTGPRVEVQGDFSAQAAEPDRAVDALISDGVATVDAVNAERDGREAQHKRKNRQRGAEKAEESPKQRMESYSEVAGYWLLVEESGRWVLLATRNSPLATAGTTSNPRVLLRARRTVRSWIAGRMAKSKARIRK